MTNNLIEITNVAILTNSLNDDDLYYLTEFISLCRAIKLEPQIIYSQKVEEIQKATYVGKGKIEEIAFDKDKQKEKDVRYLVCNFDLTGYQKRNIEKITGLEVLDRTFVILKIFEENAKTKEAKLQVEIAKLKYLKSRLVDEKVSYSQVTSGSKQNKGEGEKKIELNRRKIDFTIKMKSDELKTIRDARRTMRVKRNESSLPKVAVVGYTNAGKSTLINSLLEYCHRLEEKKVYVENALFATLETKSRLINSFRFPSFIITDTVGFVSNLPTCLVDAFRSTLEEVKEADLLVHVVDLSNDKYQMHIDVTKSILKEIGADNIPSIFLFNKYDKLKHRPSFLPKENELFTSLYEKDSVEEVINFISSTLSKDWLLVKGILPYTVNFASFCQDNYVKHYKEKEGGYELEAFLNPITYYKYKNYFE